jgi:dihydroorotase
MLKLLSKSFAAILEETKLCTVDTLTLRRPDDMHLHLRQGEMLKLVAPHAATQFARAIIMPNLTPPILNAEHVVRYRGEIEAAAGPGFTPLMTFKIVAATTPEMVKQLKEAGAIAGKLYPEGVTTNSEDGVRDIPALYPVFAEMERQELVLCLHGEMPGTFCLDREAAFLPVLDEIASNFPKLHIVLEHITTAEAVDKVLSLPENVAATITVHHLELTLDEVIGDKIQPHHFCKPVAKRPEDRSNLLQAALSGSPKFFLGTDSAPHAVETKECAHGCAGVYTAPVTMAVLGEIFEAAKALEKLEDFTSRFGAEFYSLPLNSETITLTKESWTVPDQYGSVVPYRAGQSLSWRLS